MFQMEDKWKIMAIRPLRDAIENLSKELWLEAKAKQNAHKIGLIIYYLIIFYR